ncbi:MAG: phytanoyl-CoA dioxygenase family protein [Rhizobiales bacterium]|nr:phytanoyl-CoA dioxygenase family protein [Hyphomicrobiales bacterium]
MQFLLKRFYKRKALATPNPLFYWWRDVSNGKRARRAQSTPNEYSDTRQIAQKITQEGIVVGASEQFLSKEGQQALAEAAKVVLEASKQAEVQDTIAKGESAGKKSYLTSLITWDQDHDPDSPLVKLALDKKLLEIVSQYLGLWPRLHAIGAWLNFPTKEQAVEAQLWHRDPEDLKLIKVFIYLADVDANSGPFSYIPKTHPFSDGAAKTPVHKDFKRITDDEMRVTFPSDSWLKCTGPAKTMILADTVGYHRGGKPTEGVRVLITFTYTSGTPFGDRKLRIKGRPAWTTTDIQREAL